MITEFKIFESINEGEPEEGDYVILKPANISDKDEFYDNYKDMEKFIGQISKIKQDEMYGDKTYIIKLPNLKSHWVHKNSIQFWSKDIEDMKLCLATNKYNL